MTWYMCKGARTVMDLDRTVCDDCAPVVVIDPEDREQVERLVASLGALSFSVWGCGAVSAMQAALREFANPKPPKPEEPTGLGAVVVDALGGRWVRTDPGAVAWTEWDHPVTRAAYRNIDAVKVLSPGVTD